MSAPAAPAATGGLAGRAAAGVLWTTGQKWGARLFGLATLALLTRLLTPADFGVVAIGLAIVPFLYLLSDLGFAAYLVQAESPTDRTLSTAFWYSAAAGLVLAGGLWFAGPAVEALLGIDGSGTVISGFAPAALAVALGSVPLAILRRRMAFGRLAAQGLVAGVLGQLAAVALALLGAGAMALVAQTVVQQAAATLAAAVSARWRPRLAFDPREFRAMARFGVNVVGVELVAIGRAWAENAIVALVLGVTGLGYLSIAQRLVQTAQDLGATSIVPVSTVVFAQIRAGRERLAAAYRRAQGMISLIVIPLMAMIVVAAPELMALVFGAQWDASADPARAYAVAGVLTLGATLDHGLFLGLGRSGVWFAYGLAVDAVTVLVTWLLAPFGLLAIAIGFAGVALAATLARWPLVARQLGTAWTMLAAPFVRALAMGSLAVAGGLAAIALAAALPGPARAAIAGAAVIAVSALAARLLLPEAFAEARGLASRGLATVRRGRVPKERTA